MFYSHRFLQHSNIAQLSSQFYTATQWRVRGRVADLRNLPGDAPENVAQTRALGAAIAASGIGGIIFLSRVSLDAVNLCVFDPGLIGHGVPTRRVELLFNDSTVQSRISPIDEESNSASGQ